jgi:putative transposase
MPQSLANVLLHIVFSTKDREPFLEDERMRAEMHTYLAGILKNLDSPAIVINGTADHVHILCRMSRKYSISKILEEMKSQPSSWIKQKGSRYRNFYWQGGYGAFSVSQSMVDHVRVYIQNQEEHHKRISFKDEFRALCRKHEVEWDERYVWD